MIVALGDIVRVLEETFKPIIHHDEVYYLLDGDVRYELYTATEP